MDDKQAIAQLKQGDLNGLEHLVQRYQAQAVHSAYLIIGDLPLAEDVVQAAFLKIARKIGQFDPRCPFRPWFLRAVVNDAIKAARRQQKSVSLDSVSPDGVSPYGASPNSASSSEPAVADLLMDKAVSPEELAEVSDLRRKVWAALHRLPPEQRAVIVQRHFLEMSEAEMAAELERPPSTIKWWLHSARKSLRVLLAGENHD